MSRIKLSGSTGGDREYEVYSNGLLVGYVRPDGHMIHEGVFLETDQVAELARGMGFVVTGPVNESACYCVRLEQECRSLLANDETKCQAWGLICPNTAKWDGECHCGDCGRVICSDCKGGEW